MSSKRYTEEFKVEAVKQGCQEHRNTPVEIKGIKKNKSIPVSKT